MRKILFATLAATTMIASIGAASAQNRPISEHVYAPTQHQTGGGSLGYNWNLTSPDAIK